MLASFISWTWLPFLRLLWVGARSSHTIMEFIFSELPEILFIVYLSLNVRRFCRGALACKKLWWIYGSLLLMGSIKAYWATPHIFSILYGIKITYLALLILLLNIPKEEKDKFLDIWNKYVVLYSGLSIIFHVFFFDFEQYLVHLSGHPMSAYFIARTGGFLLTPVPFAIMISFSSFYYMSLILQCNKKVYYLYLFILFIALWYSVTRIGILGCLIVFLYGMFKTKMYLRVITILLVYYVSMIIVFKTIVPFWWVIQSTANTVYLQNNVTRVELWKKTEQAFMKKPWLGYGIGHAGAGAIKYSKNNPDKAAVSSTDGWYLKILSEVGIIGFFLLLVFLYYAIDWSVIYSTKNNFVAFILLFTLISAVFNNILDFFPLNVFIYLIGKTTKYSEC